MSSPFASLILKLAGLILILGVLVDYVVAAVPPNFLDSQWLANLINEWVGRGTVPLLGLALILFGIWMEKGSADSRSKKTGRGWWLGALLLSGVLGILFLLLAPIYFRSSQLASAAETRQINQAAAVEEAELDAQLEAQRNQVSAVLSNQELLDAVQQQMQASSESSTEQQPFIQQLQEILQEVQNDPNALEQKVEEARQQGREQIREQQQQEIAELTTEMRKSRVRVTGNSILLAIGYLTIAASSLGAGQPTGRQPRTRSRQKGK